MNDSIYIAGPMNGDPAYRDKFNAAESYLIMKGWRVLNPATLPEGLRPSVYMPICLAMVQAADAIVCLAGSERSQGARIESDYAGYQGKTIYCGIETVPSINDGE